MSEKNTSELRHILNSTHIADFKKFCEDNKDSVYYNEDSFSIYIKDLLVEKKLTQRQVFMNAEIPERYGYKLLSGEKRTKQRDIILRICYAAEMTLEETQRALNKYEMSELYPKRQRDALLMIIFNDRPGSISEVNSLLIKHEMDPLRTSGVQD